MQQEYRFVDSHSHKKASRSVCSDTQSAHLLACALRQLQCCSRCLHTRVMSHKGTMLRLMQAAFTQASAFCLENAKKARLVQLYQQFMYHLCTSLIAGFWVKCLVESMKETKTHQSQQNVGGSEGCCTAVLDLHRLCLCNQYDVQRVSPCASHKEGLERTL